MVGEAASLDVPGDRVRVDAALERRARQVEQLALVFSVELFEIGDASFERGSGFDRAVAAEGLNLAPPTVAEIVVV